MNSSEIIRRAIEIGKPRGEITFDQLDELFRGFEADPKDIERLMAALSHEGINVIEP